MNASEIMKRFEELDANENRTVLEEEESIDMGNTVMQIEEHGEAVYDAAVAVFGQAATKYLQNGAYQGRFCTTQEYIEEYLLDSLGLDGIDKNWIDFDAVWDDLERGGSYVKVDPIDRGVFIFEVR